MKKFNLVDAKAGKPVCTRDGRKARIICWDSKLQFSQYPIMALVESDRNSEQELLFRYTLEGLYYEEEEGEEKRTAEESDLDLMMVGGEKKEGWINLYRLGNNKIITGLVYDTKKQAISQVDPNDFITTVKIEWEE